MLSTTILAAIVIATLANMILGTLWYSPFILGNQWIKLSGIKPKPEEMPKIMALGLLAALGSAIGLSYFIYEFAVESVFAGAILGLTGWLCFIAPVAAQGLIYEKRPFGLFLINNAYNALALAIMGAILAWFM